MTEVEWLTCKEPDTRMLKFLGKTASERKLRLFACACVRQQWSLVPAPEQPAVEVAERFADGHATEKELKEARSKCRMQPEFSGGAAAYKCAAPTASQAAKLASDWARHCLVHLRLRTGGPDPRTTHQEERAAHADLLRDIFGPLPFRPITVDPRWLSPTVQNVAAPIYAEKAFDRLPILADAMEDAGCTSHEILDHCRQPGVHCRGCWALDLLLGKE